MQIRVYTIWIMKESCLCFISYSDPWSVNQTITNLQWWENFTTWPTHTTHASSLLVREKQLLQLLQEVITLEDGATRYNSPINQRHLGIHQESLAPLKHRTLFYPKPQRKNTMQLQIKDTVTLEIKDGSGVTGHSQNFPASCVGQAGRFLNQWLKKKSTLTICLIQRSLPLQNTLYGFRACHVAGSMHATLIVRIITL